MLARRMCRTGAASGDSVESPLLGRWVGMKIRWLVVLIVAGQLGVAACSVPEEPPGVRDTDILLTSEESVAGSDEPLALPGVGRLTGRLLGPAGASFAGMVLVASEHSNGVRDERRASTEIASDGSFDLHPLPVGELSFEMVILDARSLEFDVPFLTGARLGLGEVVIEVGATTRHDFDVRDRFPGTVRLKVSVNGEPALGLRVTAKPDDDGPNWASGEVGPDGVVELEGLFPATWTLAVAGPGASYYENGEWSYVLPTPVEVSAGEEAEVTVDIPLYDGTLTVLDPQSGDPVAGATVFLDAVAGGVVQRLTDTDGRISATLPPGTYQARRWERGTRRVEPVEIEWTAAGPVPHTLRLATPEPPDGDD